MPTMQGSVVVPSGGVSLNQLAGLIHEFLASGASVTLSATGSAIGLNVTLLVAGMAVINDSALGGQNRFPIIPDDMLTEEGAFGGSRLILTFRNPTPGPLTAFWRVDVEYM